MKDIHFFGDSFTVGDELSDDEFFLWKKDCTDKEEYYLRRNKLLSSSQKPIQSYTSSNKSKAYPSLINSVNTKIHNHAASGSSLRRIILLIVQYMHLNLHENSIVYLQLPWYPREIYINTEWVDDIQMSSNTTADLVNNNPLLHYKESKILSHNILLQQAVEDILDIILIKNFLSAKNILFYLINLHSELDIRLEDIVKQTNYYDHLLEIFKKEIEVLNIFHKIWPRGTLLGGHIDQHTHSAIAEIIEKHINIRL